MSLKNDQNESGQTIAALKTRIEQLEKLVDTISRGKMAWQSTFDVITDPVMIIDQNYTITRANQALAKASGMDVRHVIGKKCHVVFAGSETPCSKCPMQETWQAGHPHSTELDPFADGRGHYHVNVYAMPALEDGREIVLHYRSLSEEKILQNKLLQAEKMAAIGTLAGGVAHEINNPLGAILAFTQLVMQELDKEHACQKDLQEIEQATKRCRTIVKDLLNFSRQNYDEVMRPLDLNQVIEKSMGLVNLNIKNKPIQLELEQQSPLPVILGHFHKLQQVFINLVSNGIDAMKQNGGILRLQTGYDAAKKRVVLSVKDQGHGIPKSSLNKIFDPYFTTKAQGEGTGLGLPISYKIVQEHKGAIDVRSRVGEGTEFLVTFPILEGEKS